MENWITPPKYVSSKRAAKLAERWQGGVWCPLTSLALTGAIVANCATSIRSLQRQIEAAHAEYPHTEWDQSALPELADLLWYVTTIGERGPVEGWSNLLFVTGRQS